MSSRFPEAELIWHNGRLIPWRDAQVHIMSLAVQFGSSVFEGIRCYKTENGPAVFRLPEHLRRLQDTCRIYRIDLPYSAEALTAAVLETVERNSLEECYIRPMILRGYGAPGLFPGDTPVESYVVAFPWGAYLGEEALEQGVDVCVSTWQRAAPNTYPATAKSAGHYNNSQLIKMEAAANGYAEAIALQPNGLVSEGSGQNLFVIRRGVLITPQSDGTSLLGITRDSVLGLAQDLGLTVREEPVPRELLYTADEMFFSGTATEVTPVRSVDKITIGEGRRGPITTKIQKRFEDVVHGRVPERADWLTTVPSLASKA